MTDLRKAAELALEALQVMKAGQHAEEKAYMDKAIEALRQALAQPEQEPTLTEKDGSPCPEFWDWLPKAYNFEGLGEFTKYNMEVAFLAGKNTALAQPEQEPVAWYYADSDVEIHSVALSEDLDDDQKANCIPLYTAPPSKPWVSLTDADTKSLENIAETHGLSVGTVARIAETLLKERNK